MGSLSPYRSLRAPQAVQPPPGPLLVFQSGQLLTRSSVTNLLRDAARCVGLPYQSLKGHSFRIGAASTAAAAGLPDWLIKVLGRCYQLYIRTPPSIVLSAAPGMGCIPGSPTPKLVSWFYLAYLNLWFLLGRIHALHVSGAVKSRRRLPPSFCFCLFYSCIILCTCH